MQIVIDIPEGNYKAICETKNVWEREPKQIIYLAIANGTPLPKGHGRLIILSEDAVKREQTSLSLSCQNWISEVGLSNATVAIIEADNAESEEYGMIYKENIKAILECYFTGFKEEIIDNACNRILEQEPRTWYSQKSCDTCEHSDEIDGNNCYECVKGMRDRYNPQPKIGHWVEENINEWSRKVFCSECGCPPPFEHISNGDVYSASGYGVSNKTKFCPNCGAKMVELHAESDEV